MDCIFRTLTQELPQIPEVHCSRERSRAAWKIIEEVSIKLYECVARSYPFIILNVVPFLLMPLLFSAVSDALCGAGAISNFKIM